MSTQAHQKLALLQEGIASALSGDKVAARRLLEQVTTSHPENELAWLWLASVCLEPMETIRCWRRVLKLNPTQEHAITGLRRLLLQEGIAAAKSGRKEEARELLIELSQIDNNSEVALLWLATVAKDAEEAQHYTERVLELNPNNERARGWLEKLQGNNQQAAAASASAEAMHTHHPTRNSTQPIRVISSSGWSCPLCGAETIKTVSRCPKCRAVVSLTNVDELLNNTELNVPLIREAVRRLEDQADLAKENIDYFTLYNLGIGCLNLNRLEEGAKYLRAASNIKLKDERLKTQVESLLHRVHQAVNGASAALNGTDEMSTGTAAAAAETVTETVGAHTILVVDDSPTIRKLVSMTLEKYGHRVLTAGNGLDAVNKLKEVVPDLILSDITMPHMDGYQLCKAIRGNAVTKKVPVIMLSGKDGIFDKLRGRMVGATAYITKPFDAESLLQLIDMHCQQER